MPAVSRVAILPRMSVQHYEPAIPGHLDATALYRKWYWRGLWWFLRKLGARYQDRIPESVRVEERTINHADIQAMIADSKRAMRYLWDKEATMLIVGHDEMSKLMRDAPRELLTFDMQVPLANGTQYRYMGLRVVCVPWLEGWALLPDLDK